MIKSRGQLIHKAKTKVCHGCFRKMTIMTFRYLPVLQSLFCIFPTLPIMTFIFACNLTPLLRRQDKDKDEDKPKVRDKDEEKEKKSIFACSAICPPCSGVTLSSHSTIAATCKEFWVLSKFFGYYQPTEQDKRKKISMTFLRKLTS